MAILGRNGAGKTTTLMALAGVVTSRAEAIRLNGEDISHVRPFKRVREGPRSRPFRIACVSDPHGEREPRARCGRRNGGAVWTIGDAYRTFPKLDELRNSSAGTLSGGEREMLAVARAMLAGPTLLMLDEPSEGLAPLVVKGIPSGSRR